MRRPSETAAVTAGENGECVARRLRLHSLLPDRTVSTAIPIKFFAVPALDPGELENEANRFVRAHRVVSIDRKLVTVNERPVWCLAIKYVDSPVLDHDAPHSSDQALRLHP